MNDDQIPPKWRRINDVCIGVPDGDGYSYTVYHVGERGAWTWEACGVGGLLMIDGKPALGLPTMEAAIEVCRNDWRVRNANKA